MSMMSNASISYIAPLGISLAQYAWAAAIALWPLLLFWLVFTVLMRVKK